MKKLRIASFDLENSPLLGWTWGQWEQDVIEKKTDWYLLSFSYKELGKDAIHYFGLPDFPGYRRNKENDKALTKKLWEFFNTFDILIAHNGDAFDVKKANARFLYHGLKPPSPYKTIDTLKISRRHFGFTSNKLDELANTLKIGRKLPHEGKHTWLGCMGGDMKSWRTMKKYNKHDVWLLEKVYLKMRAWDKSSFDIDFLNRTIKNHFSCPACGSTSYTKRGPGVYRKGLYQHLRCKVDGKWFWGEKLS